MATKIFKATGDTALQATFTMMENIATWIMQIVPNTVKKVVKEVTDPNALCKYYCITSEIGFCGPIIGAKDTNSSTIEAPQLVIGYSYYSGPLVQSNEIVYLPTDIYFDKNTKTLTYSIQYTEMLNGIHLTAGKTGIVYSEEIQKHIFFGTASSSFNWIVTTDYSGNLNTNIYQFPGYTVPQPQPNKCTLSNAIYGGKLISTIFAYNCNPTLSEYNEVMLGGERYFILKNNCCIKL